LRQSRKFFGATRGTSTLFDIVYSFRCKPQ
jgi:hypothetical protein